MNRYLVFTSIEDDFDNNWTNLKWQDIKSEGIGDIKCYHTPISGGFAKRFFKAHHSKKLNRFFNLPFKELLWGRRYTPGELGLSGDDVNYLIFNTDIKYPRSYIKKLKKKYNCVIVQVLFETVKIMLCTESVEKVNKYKKDKLIDQFWSYEKTDCEKFGFCYTTVPYSKLQNDAENEETKSDIFYIGACRGAQRLALLIDIYKKIKNKAEADFNLVGVKESDMQFEKEIIYNRPLPYPEVVKRLCGAECVLDLLFEDSGQTDVGLRYYEAVVYNKKLLTNNPSVANMPFYNPDSMKIFASPDDIDVGWITEKSEVNYSYDGRYSPVRLIEKITRMKEMSV